MLLQSIGHGRDVRRSAQNAMFARKVKYTRVRLNSAWHYLHCASKAAIAATLTCFCASRSERAAAVK